MGMPQGLKEIGKIIRTLREEKGITQGELAKLLKTTQSAVARIEKGDQNLTAETLARVSDVLKRDFIHILGSSINVSVEGGRRLKGVITVKSSKNGALVLLCAALLNRGTTTLTHVPKIEEIYRIIEVLKSIGVAIAWKDHSLLITPPKRFKLEKINKKAAGRTRTIVMFIGSLIHALKKFILPQAGGCKLGERSVRPHFFALENFGVSIKTTENSYIISREHLSPAEVVLYESGDTLTANVLMAAALIPGVTTVKYASANYQVQELCFFLESLGVKIEGIGTTTLKVHGVSEIDKNIEYAVSEDPTETMFFLAAAIVTKSAVTIRRSPIEFLELELLRLEKMGFRYKLSKPYLSFNKRTKIVDIKTLPSRLRALEEKIEPRPYPGLNIDNLPFFAVIGTQAEGTTFLHDWVYEERAVYYKELDRLGAKTLLADPHRFYITGPTPLKATEVICPPALRPSAIVLIAMLGAKGVSILRNIYSINRGYEDIVNRLNSLGARIRFIR